MKYYKGIYFRSNCLGWFACYTTQFLTDLFKDPFLSSVIPMVTPTRCHRANWGNPFVGDCGQTWFQISEFTHFNLAIRLSKAKQLAFRFFTVFREFPRLLWSQGFLAAALLRLWSRAEQSETPFLLQLQLLKWDITMSHEQPFRQAHDFQVWSFFFWWLSGEVKHIVHLIRWNLNSRLCHCGTTWPRSRQGNNARPQSIKELSLVFKLIVLVSLACH